MLRDDVDYESITMNHQPLVCSAQMVNKQGRLGTSESSPWRWMMIIPISDRFSMVQKWLSITTSVEFPGPTCIHTIPIYFILSVQNRLSLYKSYKPVEPTRPIKLPKTRI